MPYRGACWIVLLVVGLLAPAGAGCVARSGAGAGLPSSPPHVPVTVTADDGRLLVDGAPFLVKGVVYSPVPVGVDGRDPGEGGAWVRDPDTYVEDFAHMKRMGANTVRLVHASGDVDATLDLLDAAHAFDLKVVMGLEGPVGEDAGDPAVRERFLRDVRHTVVAYRDHPAVLLWVLGNEVNYAYEGEDVADWYTLLQEATLAARRLDRHHPVGTANNALNDLDLLLDLAPAVQVFGTNLYSPDGSAYADWLYPETAKRAPRMPVLVTEFGADAWDSRAGREDPDTQARVVRAGWNAIEAGSEDANGVGGFVFEWVDEWWKSGDASTQSTDGDWFPNDSGGVLPDDAFSEEWFGLLATDEDGGRRERDAYHALRDAWHTGDGAPAPTVYGVDAAVENDTVRLEARVAAYGGADVDVHARYRVNGGAWETVPMVRDDEDRWRVDVVPGASVAIVYYQVTAAGEGTRRATTEVVTVHAITWPDTPGLAGTSAGGRGVP